MGTRLDCDIKSLFDGCNPLRGSTQCGNARRSFGYRQAFALAEAKISNAHDATEHVGARLIHVPPQSPSQPTLPKLQLAWPMTVDEAYILDLCDDLLGKPSLREHRFPKLLDQTKAPILTAAFFPDRKLAIDFYKDKARPDAQREKALAEENVQLVLIDKRVFALNDAGRLIRDREEDRETVRLCLDKFLRTKKR